MASNSLRFFPLFITFLFFALSLVSFLTLFSSLNVYRFDFISFLLISIFLNTFILPSLLCSMLYIFFFQIDKWKPVILSISYGTENIRGRVNSIMRSPVNWEKEATVASSSSSVVRVLRRIELIISVLHFSNTVNREKCYQDFISMYIIL